jgi:hypothetical protein
MVTVPFFCPDTPILEKNPVFMYYPDHFKKPNPFKPDVVVDVSPVMEKKLDAIGAIVSQFAEGGANGSAKLMPDDPAGQKRRHQQVRDSMARRNSSLADHFRSELGEWYGKEKAAQVKFAEAFEVCEYGGQPDRKELKRLFPFFGE